MPDAVDLEFSISAAVGQQYRLEVRLNNPYSDQIDDPEVVACRFPSEALEQHRAAGDWVAYGRALSDAVFAEAGVLALYERALREAKQRSAAVRLRWVVDQGAPELHRLVWEALLDPKRAEPNAPAWLSTNPEVFFSRSIAGGQQRHLSLRQKFQLRALVMIANPQAPPGLRLPQIQVDAERRRAEAGLGNILTTVVASSQENPGQATLARLIEELDKTYDILYLVCHGRFEAAEDPPDTWIYLEDSEGKLDRVRGKQLVTEIQRLAAPPNLVLLMSCQTAGDGSVVQGADGALASLGPRLIRAGVPAVVAMQSDLRMETAALFFPSLLGTLQKSGVIDAAVGTARAAVSRQPDFYVPVLFHRLKSGRIWYGGAEAQAEHGEISQALVTHIADGDGTVILGSGLLEPYVGSQSEIASRLADKYGYPFAEKDRDDLALVSQYISAVQAPVILQKAYLRELALQILRQHGDSDPELRQGRSLADWSKAGARAETRMEDLLERVWERRRQTDPMEPYSKLAELRFKAYISTNPDLLMETALRDRSPIVWECAKQGSNLKLNPGLPTADRPLLAYLYGNVRRPDTLVLTEDDYFLHLTTAAAATASSVRELNNIFVGSALIFLGFRLHEWDFRIFFRRLKWMKSWSQHIAFEHVAVQLDPSSSGGHASTRDVRTFLRKFIDSSHIEVFEGSVEQFVVALSNNMQAAAASGG